MSIIAVVHAKGTSERVPNKNLRKLGGKPLICHAIKNAYNSKAARVYIDSEDDLILKTGMACGALPLQRPLYLARNEITGDDLAYWQAQNFTDAKVIVQVVPTSPFTKPETINKCIDNILSGYNSSFTSSIERLYTWTSYGLPRYYDNNKILNSKDLPAIYVEHTGVYAFKPEFVLENHKRVDIKSYRTVPISKIEQVDIDYEEDFEFAEIIWRGLQDLKIDTKMKEASSLATDQASMRLMYRDLREKLSSD